MQNVGCNMKLATFLKFTFVLLASLNANANLDSNRCVRIFNLEEVSDNFDLDTRAQTKNGDPRYFEVFDYDNFKGKALDKYLKELKGLQQFADNLPDMLAKFMPVSESVKREGFFIANQIVPIIKSYLKKHGVNYSMKSYYENDFQRTAIVIDVVGDSLLNKVAHDIFLQDKTRLVIRPIDLFFPKNGHRTKKYTEIQGELFELEPFFPAYAMSFRMLLHFKNKDFNMNELRNTDPELLKMGSEILVERMKNTNPDEMTDAFRSPEVEIREASQAEYQRQQAEKNRLKIEAARNPKK